MQDRGAAGNDQEHAWGGEQSLGGWCGEKPRAMDVMGAGRGLAGGPRRRGAVIPPVDFHGTVVRGLVFQDGRLDDGRKLWLVVLRSARPGGRPRFRGETAQAA